METCLEMPKLLGNGSDWVLFTLPGKVLDTIVYLVFLRDARGCGSLCLGLGALGTLSCLLPQGGREAGATGEPSFDGEIREQGKPARTAGMRLPQHPRPGATRPAALPPSPASAAPSPGSSQGCAESVWLPVLLLCPDPRFSLCRVPPQEPEPVLANLGGRLCREGCKLPRFRNASCGHSWLCKVPCLLVKGVSGHAAGVCCLARGGAGSQASSGSPTCFAGVSCPHGVLGSG